MACCRGGTHRRRAVPPTAPRSRPAATRPRPAQAESGPSPGPGPHRPCGESCLIRKPIRESTVRRVRPMGVFAAGSRRPLVRRDLRPLITGPRGGANVIFTLTCDGRWMAGEYADWRGHVIVCGLHGVGLRIVEQLGLSGVPAVVIDDDPDMRLARILASWNVPHIAASS